MNTCKACGKPTATVFDRFCNDCLGLLVDRMAEWREARERQTRHPAGGTLAERLRDIHEKPEPPK